MPFFSVCIKACRQFVQFIYRENIGLLMQQRYIFDGKITHNSICQIKSLLLPRGIWPAHRITFSMLAVVFFGAFVARIYFPKPYKNIHYKIQSISWHKKGNGTLLVNGDRKEWGCWGFWQHWGNSVTYQDIPRADGNLSEMYKYRKFRILDLSYSISLLKDRTSDCFFFFF